MESKVSRLWERQVPYGDDKTLDSCFHISTRRTA